MIKVIKSLQVRILVIFILVGLIPLYLLKYGMLTNYENQAVEQRGDMIKRQCLVIADEVGTSTYLEGTKSEIIDSELKQLANIYSGRVVVVNSDLEIIKDTLGVDQNRIIVSEEVVLCFKGTDTTSYNENNEYLEMTVPIKDNLSKEIKGVLIVSLPTTDISDARKKLSDTVFVLQCVLTVLVLAAAFYAAHILIKPFGKVTKSLSEVRSGFLTEDISIPDYTETQLLSEAYNKMLDRMKKLDDSRQEFVSNVSHELKTPLTSMKVLADSLISQEEVPVELYKEFMTDIAEEIDRENKIITDLLSLVKMDKKSNDIKIEEKNIQELIELILKRLRPIADKREIELVLENFKPVIAEVDETKLTLALTNLIENGIKYNKDKGWVHISLNSDARYFYVKVEDSGIGIPEESQDHIFERFYRVDKSHSREIGGTGLGLAITRSAVLMHHGAIKVYSKEGEGTTFTVRIPLKYAG